MVIVSKHQEPILDKAQLNADIAKFPQVHPITEEMKIEHSGVSRLVMIDRYSFKDTEKKTLKVGDFVVLTVKEDPKFPARGLGFITALDEKNGKADIWIERDFRSAIDSPEAQEKGIITRPIDVIEKPLEVFYEQIAKRNATGLASVETTEEKRKKSFDKFLRSIVEFEFHTCWACTIRSGIRHGSDFFQLLRMPFVADSREGISDHRKQVMEIMSRGGGVGTNGSTLTTT